uniref:Uncharacterized protein n=1 Tax=Populus trichocarpa TaxID=3694 RepID=A0A2K1Z0T6_POPTR
MWRFFLSLEDRHCSLESDKTGSRALKQKLITLSVLHPTIFVFTGNGSKYSLIILWTFFQMVFSVESVDP